MTSNILMAAPKTEIQQDDKRNRLLQRKQGMFRRSKSIDNLFAAFAAPATELKESGRPKPTGMRRCASVPEDVSRCSAPLIPKRWDTEDDRTDRAPCRPSHHQKRRKNRRRSRESISTVSMIETSDANEGPLLSRWDSENSLDKSSKKLLNPHSAPRRPTRISPVRTRASN